MPLLSEYIVAGNGGFVRWEDSFGYLNLDWDPVKILNVIGNDPSNTFVEYYQIVYG